MRLLRNSAPTSEVTQLFSKLARVTFTKVRLAVPMDHSVGGYLLREILTFIFAARVASKATHERTRKIHMKVFLDDVRPTPKGWIRVYWPDEAIRLLESGIVEEISLDHDLGDDARGTGYDVILWIEEAVALRGFKPPRIMVHSANSSAVDKMRAGVHAIERLASRS
jgi:hypothetical protein